LKPAPKINGSVSLTSTNKFVTSESESGAGTVTSTGDANLVLVSGASAAASLVKNAAGTYEAVAQADASAEGAAHVEGELFGEMIGGLTHQEEMMSIVENGLDLEGSAYANAAAAVTDKTYFNGKAGYTYLVKANQTPVDVGADDTTSSVVAEPTVFDTTFAGYGSQTMNDYPTYLLTKIGMTTDQIKAAITKIPAINATEDQLSQFKMILSMAMNLYTVDAYVDSVSGDVTFKGSLSSQNIENIKEFPVLEMVGLILQSEVNSGKLSDSTAAVASALIEKLHNMDNKSKMTLPDTAKLNLEVKLNADYFPVSLSYDVDLTGFNELIDLTYTAPTTDENSSEVVVDGPLSSKLSGNIGFERFIASGSLDFTYGDDIEPLTFSAEDKAAALAGTDYSEAIESYFAPKKDVPIAQ
jgi:hypothetical protein